VLVAANKSFVEFAGVLVVLLVFGDLIRGLSAIDEQILDKQTHKAKRLTGNILQKSTRKVERGRAGRRFGRRD
jgi:hypothetical protein